MNHLKYDPYHEIGQGGETMEKKNVFIVGLVLSVVFLLVITQAAWPQNTADQSRPIELGTSGGNIKDISSKYCCTGTLGALVKDTNGVQYILSNNHVLARTNLGKMGEAIIQPGLGDQEIPCNKDTADKVANLTKFVSISFKGSRSNTVDAAIAQVRNDCVDPDGNTVNCVDSSGSILGIGPISGTIVRPTSRMSVQKSGRTTGLTDATISAVNVSLFVTYNKTCGMGSQLARFSNQFKIDGAGFSSGGDSGSLIVQNSPSTPAAVGLLFAGSSTTTFANPISSVLSALRVSLVGTSTGSHALPMAEQVDQIAVQATAGVKERHENRFMQMRGVVGMGVGLPEAATEGPVIEVYVKKLTRALKLNIPATLEGVPVKIIETGEVFAY